MKNDVNHHLLLRQEVTSGCQPLNPHLPRVKGKRGFGGAYFFSLSYPCDSEALERKCPVPDAVHETTTVRHSKSQMLWRMETTQCIERRKPYIHPYPPLPGHKKEGDHVNE